MHDPTHSQVLGQPRWRPIWVDHLSQGPCSVASPSAVHDHAALALVLDGQLVHEQRGRFEARPGDVVLVPAGQRHRSVGSTGSTAVGVGFCPACYASSRLAELLDPFERARAGASPVVTLPSERHEHLRGLIRELHAETQAPRPHAELVQTNLLALILAEVTRAASLAAPTELQPSVVTEALRYIERACFAPISLAEVARAVGRSPAYLTTAVKRATGKSVGEWITTGRLAEARNRLLHTDDSVARVAEHVGYADPTHFIRVFRKAHGLTPAAWRDQQRGRGRRS